VSRAKAVDPETYVASDAAQHDADEMAEIFERAVRKARDDNRKRGIPNVHVEDGWIVEELPNGTLKRLRSVGTPATASPKKQS